jgi:carboxyl-terminal processing protease
MKITKLSLLVVFGSSLGILAGSFATAKAPKNTETYNQLVIFADVLSRVQNEYIEEVDDKDLVADALNGVLQSLDPHSKYVPPQDFEKQQKRARREYGGLGIEVSMADEGVEISYVNPEGPAFRAGLKAKDFITHVEGKNVIGSSLNDATDKMRGLAGDAISITVKSPNRSPRIVKITREVVQGRAVRHRMIEGIGYVYLETFSNENLDRDMIEAIDLLTTENKGTLRGLIVDVRGNGGGLLTQSINIAGEFLDGGEVVSVRGRKDGENDRYHAKSGQKLAGVPIVVLVNGDTASASEIVAGALQDRGRALIVGTLTFGKGSVQSVYPLRGGRGGALRLTTARYFTPSGRSIHGLGVTPDVWVEPFAKDSKQGLRIREATLPHALDIIIHKTEGQNFQVPEPEHEYPPKDWSDDKDFQLERALEIIKSQDYNSRLRQAFNNDASLP